MNTVSFTAILCSSIFLFFPLFDRLNGFNLLMVVPVSNEVGIGGGV